jgi:hypothetical protein
MECGERDTAVDFEGNTASRRTSNLATEPHAGEMRIEQSEYARWMCQKHVDGGLARNREAPVSVYIAS